MSSSARGAGRRPPAAAAGSPPSPVREAMTRCAVASCAFNSATTPALSASPAGAGATAAPVAPSSSHDSSSAASASRCRSSGSWSITGFKYASSVQKPAPAVSESRMAATGSPFRTRDRM